MKEEVLKILKDWLQAKDAIIFTDDIAIDEVADELNSMVMEFIIWLHDNSDDTSEDDKLWWIIPLEAYVNTEIAFEYWKTNIKK
jgi:hypothetical protein